MVSSFDSKQDKHSFYRGKDWTKTFSKDLKKHAIKIINFEEKEMKPLKDIDIKFYEEQKVCHISKKEF